MRRKVNGVRVNCPELQTEGLTLYVDVQKAKRQGMDRICIQLQQDQAEAWQVTGIRSTKYIFDVDLESDEDVREAKRKVAEINKTRQAPQEGRSAPVIGRRQQSRQMPGISN